MLSRGILLIHTDDENVKSESSVDESFEYYFHLKGECLIKVSLTETVSFKNVFEETSVYILNCSFSLLDVLCKGFRFI